MKAHPLARVGGRVPRRRPRRGARASVRLPALEEGALGRGGRPGRAVPRFRPPRARRRARRPRRPREGRGRPRRGLILRRAAAVSAWCSSQFRDPTADQGRRRIVPDRYRPVERGLYIAAAGMLAELARQDRIANDLANATTPGYKREEISQHSFGDALLSNRKTGAEVGSLGYGPVVAETAASLEQEPLRETGQALDVALQGDGAFAVQAPGGT